MAQIVFVMIGVFFLLLKLNVSGSRLVSSIAIILLGIPIIMLIVFIQKQGLFAILLRLLQIFRIKIRYIAEREERLRELDKNIYLFYSHNKKEPQWFLFITSEFSSLVSVINARRRTSQGISDYSLILIF